MFSCVPKTSLEILVLPSSRPAIGRRILQTVSPKSTGHGKIEGGSAAKMSVGKEDVCSPAPLRRTVLIDGLVARTLLKQSGLFNDWAELRSTSKMSTLI